MTSAGTDAKKRLPKELQDYKREIKKLPFKEKVEAYFNCAPFINKLDSQKKDIILKSFSSEERKEYYRKFLPIYNSIERYGDAIRAINANRIIYGNYLDTALRVRDNVNYTADFLNLIIPKVKEALDSTKEDDTRETLKQVTKTLKSYSPVSLLPEMKINEEGTYEVLIEERDKYLLKVIVKLKSILSLLKCYLESLKEFLEWVGTPELLPKEFKDMEWDLETRYKVYQRSKGKNPDADKFPLFFAESEVTEEYISIDYSALPRTIDIFGENNIFANTYRRFFNY